MSLENLFGVESPIDIAENKFGIDILELMVRFFPLLEVNSAKQHASEVNRFKSYLVEKIKRGITKTEEIDFYNGIIEYIRTEGGTKQRLKAMKFLFELKFLK